MYQKVLKYVQTFKLQLSLETDDGHYPKKYNFQARTSQNGYIDTNLRIDLHHQKFFCI